MSLPVCVRPLVLTSNLNLSYETNDPFCVTCSPKTITGRGRTGESAAFGITEQLVDLGFSAGRMKTGTPPRVDGRSLDYEKMQEQKGDKIPEKFSYLPDIQSLTNQKSCWITHTNAAVHEQLQLGFDQSPMFNGRIKGLGPRYCPSIEDKINRFCRQRSSPDFRGARRLEHCRVLH